MDIDIVVQDIDRTLRIGVKTENKCRSITTKFLRYLERRKVFNSKKKLKGKSLSVTEILTKLRMSKLRAAKDELGFRDVLDGKIL